jgi:hypothetical protein
MADFNKDELDIFASCGIPLGNMGKNQQAQALIERIKLKSLFIKDRSATFPDGRDDTIGEYLADIKDDLKQLNAAVTALNNLVNNPKNWKV